MKNWSLNKKVWGLLLVVIGMAIGIAGYSFYGLHTLQNNFEDVTNNFVHRRLLAATILDNQRQLVINSRIFLLKDDISVRKELEGKIKDNKKNIEDAAGEFHSLALADGKKMVEDYLLAFHKWYASLQEVLNKGRANRLEALHYMDTVENPLRLEALKINTTMSQLTDLRLKESKESSLKTISNIKTVSATFAILGIIISSLLAFFVLSKLTKTINQIILSLNENSEQVRNAAQQIASASEELSQASTEQASSLEETASSIEELNSMVQKNAENARGTSDIAKSSKNSAMKGKEVVQEMMKAISDIDASNGTVMQSIDESNEKLAEIVQVINQIGNKTKVINDIVSQTRLLSINASVEAAKAQEHGKGFAVVASEVNNLARMSGEAAKEISSMLEESVVKVQSIVSESKSRVDSIMTSGKTKIDTGVRVAVECGVVLDEIVKNVMQVTEMANEIAVGSQEQAQGVQEITRAMTQLDQVTQTNASTSEEAASAAEELSAQSESLRKVVNLLAVTIKGNEDERKVDVLKEVYTAPQITPKGKVLPLKSHGKKKVASSQPVKMASGGDLVPDEHDPRFKEV